MEEIEDYREKIKKEITKKILLFTMNQYVVLYVIIFTEVNEGFYIGDTLKHEIHKSHIIQIITYYY